jgi:hypothetical protein
MAADMGTLKIGTAERVVDPAGLRARLEQPGSQGWVCFTDRVVAWSGAAPSLGGHVLAAEIALRDGRTSLHVRLEGGAWEVRELERQDGDTHRIQLRTHLAQGPHEGPFRPEALRYEVWWRAEEREEGVRTWAPFAARFAGFEGAR